MRKIRFAALLAALMMLMSSGAFAANTPERIDLGNGFYMLVEDQMCDIQLFDSGRTSTKAGDVYYSNTKVGRMTVQASFTFTGTSVAVASKSCTGTGANGWTASNNYATGSGGTVTGYCTFSKGSSKTTANLSISCDKNGNIS